MVAAVELEVSMWSHDSTELADAVARLLTSRAFTSTHVPRVDVPSSAERGHEHVGAR